MQLICDGVSLDLYDNAGLQFTNSNPLFAFDDLKCERTTNFKLPATPTNDRVFSLAKIPAYSGEGMRRKFTCQLQDGAVVRDGYLYVANFDGKDYNAVFVTGELVGLQRIRDLGKLSELIEYTDTETFGGAGVSPTAAQYDVWRNVNYLKPAGDTLRPSLNASRLYYDILLKNGIPAAPLQASLEGMRIIPAELKGADTAMRFKCTIADYQQPSSPTPTNTFNTLIFDSSLFDAENTEYGVAILQTGGTSPNNWFNVRQYKAKTNLTLVIPDDWPDTLYIYDLSGIHEDEHGDSFYGGRYFSKSLDQSGVTVHGDRLSGRSIDIAAGETFSFVDSRYYSYDSVTAMGRTTYNRGFMLNDGPTFNTDYTISVKTGVETGNLVRAQDNLPDISFIEYCKTLAALQGKVLSYKESGYTNLFVLLPVASTINATYDRTTATIQLATTGDVTFCNIFGSRALGSSVIEIMQCTSNGAQYASFVKDATWQHLYFYFDKGKEVYIDATQLEDGATYTMWLTYTGGVGGNVANICVVKGGSAVTWSQWQRDIKGIVFDGINYNSYTIQEITNILKKGEVVRTFGAYAQNNLVQFNDENADKLLVNYTIYNDNLDSQKELQTIPFSEGMLLDSVLYVGNSEKDILGLNTGGANLGRVQLPKNENLQALCEASTQIKIDARMPLLQYDSINPQTGLLVDGSTYLWTERSWQKDVAKITLAKFDKFDKIPTYIQDGLVFWLDAEDFNGGSTWVERIYGYVFQNSGVIKENNYAYFGGNQSLNYNADVPGTLYKQGTIEVVFQQDPLQSFQNQFIYRSDFNTANFCFGWHNYGGIDNSFWLQNAKRDGGMTFTYDFNTASEKKVISANYLRIYQNLISKQLIQQGSYLSYTHTNKTWIGQYGKGHYYKGKLYCIRIYNRQLTDNEMLNNQIVDNARFNLGL